MRLFILTTLFLTLSLAWLACSAPAAIERSCPLAAIEETSQFLLGDNQPKPISAHFSRSPLDGCYYCGGYSAPQCSELCWRYGYKYYACGKCYCYCS
ncbi:hypothetical protein C1645_775015, partial [Glomus cerebriforme]